MGNYLLRRLVTAVFVIVGVLALTFIAARIIPGDPARLYAGHRSSPEQAAQTREELGLDDPLILQFGRYVGSMIQGDFGFSLRTKRAIRDDLAIFLPATLEIVIPALLLALFVGVLLGVYAAVHHGRWADQATRLFAVSGLSMPPFWLALLLQLLFFSRLDLLPLGGRLSSDVALISPIQPLSGFYTIDSAITGNWLAFRDTILHLILPVLVLVVYPLGLIARMTRGTMINVLGQPHILTARAYSIPSRSIYFRHALRNALRPVLTVFGLAFAFAITGAVLIEYVFSWPGLGSYLVDAIVAIDFPVIMAVTFLVSILYVAVNLTVDILHLVLEPQIRVD